MSNIEVILSALGTFIVLVLGALGGWWIKISNNRHQQNMDLKKLEVQRDIDKQKLDAANIAKTKRDTSKEWNELSEKQSEMLNERGQEIHDLRDRLSVSELKEQKCQMRVTRLETVVEEQINRLEEAFQHIGDLEDALSKAGVTVIRRRKPKPGSKDHNPLRDGEHG